MKKIFAVLLCSVMFLLAFPTSVLAASYTENYSSFNSPEASDYAYWNGKKVVAKATKSEIKWMQAALNKCINYDGLNATKLNVDGSFGPASKKATEAFQRATNLSVDGSFGPATIKKMKAVLTDGKATFKKYVQATTKNTVVENKVIYTYITSTVDTSSMDNWIKSMKQNKKYVAKSNKGAIVAAKVLNWKTVTWIVPKNSIYSGPGITGTISIKYKVPQKIQYKLHSHTRNIGYGSSIYYAGGCIVTCFTCNCGYRKEIMSWEIPLPDLTKYSDVQTTQKVIQGLPQIN